jgi:hypothetical protein
VSASTPQQAYLELQKLAQVGLKWAMVREKPPDRQPGKMATWSVYSESVDTSCVLPTRWPWVRGIAIA